MKKEQIINLLEAYNEFNCEIIEDKSGNGDFEIKPNYDSFGYESGFIILVEVSNKSISFFSILTTGEEIYTKIDINKDKAIAQEIQLPEDDPFPQTAIYSFDWSDSAEGQIKNENICVNFENSILDDDFYEIALKNRETINKEKLLV